MIRGAGVGRWSYGGSLYLAVTNPAFMSEHVRSFEAMKELTERLVLQWEPGAGRRSADSRRQWVPCKKLAS